VVSGLSLFLYRWDITAQFRLWFYGRVVLLNKKQTEANGHNEDSPEVGLLMC
jgi:hypothetical protein